MQGHLYTLRDGWQIAADPENIGKRSGWENATPNSAVEATVPSIIQQFLPEYHGVAWYWCSFAPNLAVGPTERVWLRFGGVDYKAEVWLNGTRLGEYEGGETPFSFDVTRSVRLGDENLLAVRVINPTETAVDGLNLINTPHRNKVIQKSAGSNLNHGGIWYDVSLVVLPMAYLDDVFLTGDIRSGALTAELSLASLAELSIEAELQIRVSEKNDASDFIVGCEEKICILPGQETRTLTVTVPNHRLWSVDDPHLYLVEVRLTSALGVHLRTLAFGFREFLVKDGFFYLNGQKLLIKSAHSGNAFPIGQMFPVRPDHVRKDFIYAKAAGFNMLRAIAGLFRPEQLEIADEIGLLIYEECLAAWCLGYSHCETWRNAEEFARVEAAHPNMPIGDEAAMLARWEHANTAMIRRDRNHASVVVWGLLNETLENSVFRTAVDFLPKARQLDPSRLILLNSGRFDRDYSIGSASNPGSFVWENVWGSDGGSIEDAGSCAGDAHDYPQAPMDRDSINRFRTMGSQTGKPVFLSEFGIGGLFHVIEEWKHFKQYGLREDLEDCSWVAAQSESLTRDWARLGLTRVFPFAEMMLAESRRQNADERKRNFDIVRANPNFSGYSLTGLLDHGMCGEGLWSYFRRWKPEMFDAVSEGWAPLRFCLFAEPHVTRATDFEIEAVLASDGVLPTGTYTADFAIIGEIGVVETFTESFALDASQFAVPIMRRTLALDVPAGKYRLVASLREGAPMANETSFILSDPADLPRLDGISVSAVGLGADVLELLRRLGAEVSAEASSGLILVGSADAETIRNLLAAAEAGATVVFLDAEVFLNAEKLALLAPVAEHLELNRSEMWDWLYHKEFVLADREVFAGLGSGLLELPRFGEVFPHPAFRTPTTPSRVICPGFQTGYYAVPGAYALFHALAGFSLGQGEVVLNSFAICDHLSHPAAARLLANLIGVLAPKKKGDVQ